MAVAGVGISHDSLNLNMEVSFPPDLLSADGWRAALAQEMPNLANQVRDFWVTRAGQALKTSRREYQDGISVQTVTADSFVVSLSGWLPNAVEMGTPPFAMGPGFRGKIIPLNVDRQEVFANPTVFRMGSSDGWQHPGFPGKLLHADVLKELDEHLIPAAVERMIEMI